MKMNIKKILVLGATMTVLATTSVFAAPANSKMPTNNNGKPNIEQSQKGERGEKGAKGDRSERGAKGDRGERSEKGPRGDRGDKGERGERPQPRN